MEKIKKSATVKIGLILAVLIAVSLSGCASTGNSSISMSGKDAIVGKWSIPSAYGGMQNVQFYKGATVVVTEKDMIFTGNYKFIDDNDIRIDFGGIGALAGPMVYEIAISGKTMTLKDAKGKVSTYTRID